MSRTITTDDLQAYLTYLHENAAKFDDFNVSIADTIIGSLLHFVEMRDEQAKAAI